MQAGGGATGIACLLADTARRLPERTALVHGEQSLRYAELERAVDRLSARLREAGGPLEGQRVAIVAPNVPALVLALFAAYRAGAVAVPLSARLREHEIRGALEDAKPALVLSVRAHGGYSFADLGRELARDLSTRWLVVAEDGTIEEDFGAAAEPAKPLDAAIAAILYTSGTTGQPKGALVTHVSEVNAGTFLPPVLQLGPSDAALLVVPITHRFGYTSLHATIASGGSAVLSDAGASLEPVLQELERGRVNVLHGTPALFASLAKARGSALAGVRGGFVAGSKCPSELLEQLDHGGTRILNMYGLTETGAVTNCRLDDPPEVRYETVGPPLPGFEVRTAGEDREGELQVRGPGVMPGYHEQPEQTAEAFADGWFRTGDVASIDESGAVRISGRIKEIVHVGGFNVYPAEVEGVLLTHPGVERAGVVGVPHEKLGEALEAFVVAREGSELTAGDLLRFARERIAGYKLPYAIRFLDELPTLTSGKPDRGALAALSASLREHATV